jgi:hypothetical protein
MIPSHWVPQPGQHLRKRAWKAIRRAHGTVSQTHLRSLGELPQIMGGPTVCVVICLPRFVCLILSEMGPSGDVIGYHCGKIWIDTREHEDYSPVSLHSLSGDASHGVLNLKSLGSFKPTPGMTYTKA